MRTSFGKVGFIGLGVMGEPMCARLAAHSGLAVLGYDRDAAALERARSRSIELATSLREVMAADIVFLSLPSGEVVAKLAREAGGLLELARPEQVIVDLSTSAVDTTRALAQEFAARGVAFADSPVARTRAAAEAGTLLAMVGAPTELFERIQPLIATFASDVRLCGDVGCGQVVKILNNMVMFEIGVALAEARAIGMRAGLDPRLLFEVLSLGSADSFALRNHGIKAIVPDEFPLRAFSVEYARKDLRYALRLAEGVHVHAHAARNVDWLFERAIADGKGEQYWPVISQVVAAN